MEKEGNAINISKNASNILAIIAMMVGIIGFQFSQENYLPILNKGYASVILAFCALPLGSAFLLPKPLGWYSLAFLPFLVNIIIAIDRSELSGPGETCKVIEAYIPGHTNKETTTYSNPIAHLNCEEMDLEVHIGNEAFYKAESNHILSKFEGRLGFEYYE